MDDISVGLEHVDLLNGLDWLNIELLQRSLQLLVIGTGALVDLLDLASRSSLSTVEQFCQPARLSPSNRRRAGVNFLPQLRKVFSGSVKYIP